MTELVGTVDPYLRVTEDVGRLAEDLAQLGARLVVLLPEEAGAQARGELHGNAYGRART